MSFFGNSNFVGAVLCVGAPLAWWVWTRGRSWRIPAALLPTAVSVAMWAADVRLGFASVTVGLAAFALAAFELPWQRVPAWLVAAVPVGRVLPGLATIASAAALIGDGNGIARVPFWRTAAIVLWVAALVLTAR